MAEALISALIERLTSVTLNNVQQELKLVIGVDKEINILTGTLRAVQAVLEDAEQRQVLEASVKVWLSNLKEVSEEMEDVLDEWNTEILKQQIVQQQRAENADLVNKVCFSTPSSLCCCGVIRRHDIAKKIKDLSERLTSIDDDGRRYFQLQCIERSPGVVNKPQKTSSLLVTSFGREYEKESLVRKLLNEGSQEGRVPFIIPIVGMGGIGKTNLSQLVFNDENVKAHFDKRIWISVSDPFEVISIVMGIAEGLGIRNHPTSNALETYVQFIDQRVEGKKLLIVLDDVWNPTYYQWEQIINPLRKCARGSKILVTTRNENVAVMIGAECHMTHLEMLSEKYSQSLFFHFATIGRPINEAAMFEVGEEIVRKCKGLPLAVKTLGSLMCSKKTLREWENVLNSRIWELKEFEQNVFKPLLLSYYDLSPTTRRCLLYCAIFPKDYQINKFDLIHLWMSQDYLHVKEKPEDKMMMMMVGQEHFDDLVMRSWFQDYEQDDEGNIRNCKIHDIVHDFLQYLTNNEFAVLHVRYPNKKLELPNDKVRHVNLSFNSEDVHFPSRNLRTVILNGYWGYGFKSILQLKGLRTLNMCRYWGLIPKEIGRLIHLRYLKLSHNLSEEFPETICDLYNLQTLIAVDCPRLKKLPQGVGKLINLRHLDVRGCQCLDLKGTDKLRLRTLLHHAIPNGTSGSEVRISFSWRDSSKAKEVHW